MGRSAALERPGPGLRETPLMVVLLTMLTTEHELAALPVGRGPVLARVLDDAVTRWETGFRLQGERPRLGSLEGSDATHAARSGFAVIAHHLFEQGDPTLEDVLRHLADGLAGPFGLPSGRAAGVAEDALGLWDEAGVFVISGSTGRVQARLRLFAELGEAAHVTARDPDEQRAWAREAVWDADAHEAVLLAAGLSRAVADELLASAIHQVEELPPLELVAEAARQRVPFDEGASARWSRRCWSPTEKTRTDSDEPCSCLTSLSLKTASRPAWPGDVRSSLGVAPDRPQGHLGRQLVTSR
jgi:hypothetical protein